MITLSESMKARFGCKVYKIALDGGFTCPVRDGTLDTRGCIFCSAGGSGEFAESRALSITEQIEQGKRRVGNKIREGKYIAYFQAYTGTYAPVSRLRELYREAIDHPDIAALSIATRPDCLPEEVLDLLEELSHEKPVWIELGLGPSTKKRRNISGADIRFSVYDRAVTALRSRGIEVITHLILGLREKRRRICASLSDTSARGRTDGIKLQLLHIHEERISREYEAGRVHALTEDEYIDILKQCVPLIPDSGSRSPADRRQGQTAFDRAAVERR